MYCFVINTRHTPPYVPLTSILSIDQSTPHRTHGEQIIGYYRDSTQSTLSTDAHMFYVLVQPAIRSIIADSHYWFYLVTIVYLFSILL